MKRAQDFTPEQDAGLWSISAGKILCMEVMSILKEASFSGEVLPKKKLLNAVLQFAYQNGYTLTLNDGIAKMIPADSIPPLVPVRKDGE